MEPDMIRAIGIGIAFPAALLLSAIIIWGTGKYVKYQIRKEEKLKKRA